MSLREKQKKSKKSADVRSLGYEEKSTQSLSSQSSQIKELRKA